MITKAMKERIITIYDSDSQNRSFKHIPTDIDINILLGKTIIEIDGMESESEYIFFKCSDGTCYVMYHEQDCCEEVDIEDVCGDVNALLNTPVTMAECTTDSQVVDGICVSCTYTFYKLATVKGYVTIRWYGESNGYYSEEVNFVKIGKEETKNE